MDASNSTTIAHTTPSLLGLPAEVRLGIYDFVLEDAKSVEIHLPNYHSWLGSEEITDATPPHPGRTPDYIMRKAATGFALLEVNKIVRSGTAESLWLSLAAIVLR